jgi:hypothetical protein
VPVVDQNPGQSVRGTANQRMLPLPSRVSISLRRPALRPQGRTSRRQVRVDREQGLRDRGLDRHAGPDQRGVVTVSTKPDGTEVTLINDTARNTLAVSRAVVGYCLGDDFLIPLYISDKLSAQTHTELANC